MINKTAYEELEFKYNKLLSEHKDLLEMAAKQGETIRKYQEQIEKELKNEI